MKEEADANKNHQVQLGLLQQEEISENEMDKELAKELGLHSGLVDD